MVIIEVAEVPGLTPSQVGAGHMLYGTGWCNHDTLKAKLSMCLAKYRAMKTWGSGGIAPHVFNLGARWR